MILVFVFCIVSLLVFGEWVENIRVIRIILDVDLCYGDLVGNIVGDF